jgi:hypothetical protein
MIMKRFICLIPMLASADCTLGQDYQAPQWTIAVKVIDEHAQPVAHADVKVAWHVPPPEGESIAMTNVFGATDDDGVFTTTRRSGSIEVFCGVEKSGYYSAGRVHEFARFRNNDPQKWSPAMTLLLKRVGSPIPMHAKRIRSEPSAKNEKVGYDFEAGDWVTPHGNGSKSEIFVG